MRPDISSQETQGSLSNAVMSGAMWSAMARIATQVLSIVNVAIVARVVAPQAYGLMNMAQIAIGIIALLRDVGFGNAVVQRQTVNDRFLSSVFWVTVALGVLTSLLCYVLAPLVALFYREPALVPMLQVLSSSFFLTNITTVHVAVLIRGMNFRTTALIDLAGVVTGQIAAISFALHGGGVWSLVAASLTSAATSTLALFIFTPWRPRWLFSLDDIKSVSKFGLNLSGFNIVNFFARNADNALIGRYLGGTALGYYEFAYQIMLYPVQGIAQLLGRVLFPAFAKMQGDNVRLRAAYLRSCNAIAFLCFPIMSGVALLSKQLVELWLGPQWMPAATLVTILAPVGIIQCLTTTTGQIYMATGRTDTMLRTGFWISLTILVSFVIGIRWGALGVATAYAIAILIITVPCFVIPFRLIGLRFMDLIVSLKPIMFATLVMSVVVMVALRVMQSWTTSAIYTTIVCSSLGAMTYFGTAFLLKAPVIADLWQMIRARQTALATNAA